jgi:lipopolysaccharide export system protein LptA
MPLPIYRLRRLLVATAVVLTLGVFGMYFYARMRVRDVRKEVPHKLGIGISKTANGYRYSSSDGQRTLFSIEAADLKQFKLNGHAELHKVSIILYGRDSSRYDQIYGDDFGYDPKTGEVTAKGEVQIDLVANPEGSTHPDQAAPKIVKNAIHLKTRDLVFDKDTGDAFTNARVEFSTPQASGWAVGVKYAGKRNVLTLLSQIHMEVTGPNAAIIDADHGEMTNEPREIVLDDPKLQRRGSNMQADRAVFHLSPDNNVESINASGHVLAETKLKQEQDQAEAPTEIQTHANEADLQLTGTQNLLRTATLTGNVHIEQIGSHPMQGDAGRLILLFAGQNQLQSVRATDGARLFQNAVPAPPKIAAESRTRKFQNFELTAGTIDFKIADGQHLQFAQTSGAAQIIVTSAGDSLAQAQTSSSLPQQTVITAGAFQANFATAEGRTYPVRMHGAPNARIVNSAPGQPDRVSTSQSLDASFLPQGGIESVTQTGNVVYTDNQARDKRVQAWASNARYTPSDQLLVLTGSPRIQSGSMVTTAKTIHIDRATGLAAAETDVRSTYSELKEQPTGALLASSSPIHVTAHTMTAQNNPGVAVYTGNARVWQDANVIEAPSIQFDREKRSLIAQGVPGQPAQTTLIQDRKVGQESQPHRSRIGSSADKPTSSQNDASPITITAAQLTYTDSDRKAHYEGGVIAKGPDFTATCQKLDAYLRPRGENEAKTPSEVKTSSAGPGQLDRMIAQGDVLVQQPNRRAEGQKLVYTAADDKFVLTGGPPSIFDAEQGKITGVSLTFFRRDDRVLVEGGTSRPVVTETRVAR